MKLTKTVPHSTSVMAGSCKHSVCTWNLCLLFLFGKTESLQLLWLRNYIFPQFMEETLQCLNLSGNAFAFWNINRNNLSHFHIIQVNIEETQFSQIPRTDRIQFIKQVVWLKWLQKQSKQIGLEINLLFTHPRKAIMQASTC